MRKYIYKITINDKYTFNVYGDNSKEAEDLAKEFYSKNNYFIEKEVKKISSQRILEISEIVKHPAKER